jgi:predicted MFS family arabinose efflux permease
MRRCGITAWMPLVVIGYFGNTTCLLMTVLGFAGVFMVFTYIQAVLTTVAGFADSAVSSILLVFGDGLVFGNLLGGRLVDRRLTPTFSAR